MKLCKRILPIFFVHFYKQLSPILVNLVTLDPGSAYFLRIRIRIQGVKNMRIHANPGSRSGSETLIVRAAESGPRTRYSVQVQHRVGARVFGHLGAVRSVHDRKEGFHLQLTAPSS